MCVCESVYVCVYVWLCVYGREREEKGPKCREETDEGEMGREEGLEGGRMVLRCRAETRDGNYVRRVRERKQEGE